MEAVPAIATQTAQLELSYLGDRLLSLGLPELLAPSIQASKLHWLKAGGNEDGWVADMLTWLDLYESKKAVTRLKDWALVFEKV